MPPPQPNQSALSIAIVGVGPKGLYCLERLAVERHRGHLPRDTRLHLFESHPAPGAGPVYDPAQPAWLRMNFPNGEVGLWSRPPTGLPLPQPTLVEWLAAHRPELADPEGHAPRGAVGDYLHDGFRALSEFLDSRVRLRLHRARVTSVEPAAGGWRVAGDGVDGNRVEVTVDEVVVTTGHDSRRRPPDALPTHPRVVPGVFPVTRHLGADAVPAGSVVAVRGFGLTTLDALLTLTEGRGGRFGRSGRGSRWSYHPGGREPRVLLPYSRTGRPMLPKPDFVEPPEGIADLFEEGLARVRGLAPGADVVDRLLDALADLAAGALAAVRGSVDAGDTARLRDRLDHLAAGRDPVADGTGAGERLRQAVEVAYGERPRGDDWALGETWRRIFPALSDLVARRVLTGAPWDRFSRLRGEMERLAFGPPAENAARLLALVRAGVVDLGWLTDPEVRVGDDHVHLKAGGRRRTADLLVDGVLAPPGAAPHPSPLLAGLLRAGHARTVPWGAGIEVTPAGRCVGADGRVTPGLSVIGRPTEGSILGNDTLGRHRNDLPTDWAESVARRALRRAQTA